MNLVITQVFKVAILFGLVLIVDKLFAQEQQDQPSLEQLIAELQKKEEAQATVQEEQVVSECEPMHDVAVQEPQEINITAQSESDQQ